MIIVLMAKKITYVLDTVMPMPEEGASKDEIAHYVKYIYDSTLAQCYMLGSMTPELQRQHEKLDARSILLHSANCSRNKEGLSDIRYLRASFMLGWVRGHWFRTMS